MWKIVTDSSNRSDYGQNTWLEVWFSSMSIWMFYCFSILTMILLIADLNSEIIL